MGADWKHRIRNSKPVFFLAETAKKIVLPGFEKVPLYNVMKFFFQGIQKGAITSRASAVAYSFFLGIFPSIIFLFTLIPYVPIDNFQQQLMQLLSELMPKAAYESTQSTLEEIITHQNSGLLSFGFIAALYFSTNGFAAMISAFNNTYHEIETRTWLMQRMVSLLLVLIITVLLITAIGLIIFSELALNKMFEQGAFSYFLLRTGRWIILFMLCFCMISFMYYLGPAKKVKWRFISAGSTLATFLSIVTSIGFTYYVNHFGKYNKLYGSIGTLIIIMLWIYFNALTILIGFELNASIDNAKKVKK